MKTCASCGASLPDGAAFCIGCGSREFKAAYMPDLNAQEEEKPKVEYDQYGRPIGPDGKPIIKSYDDRFDQPQFGSDYSEGFTQEYAEQFNSQQYLDSDRSQSYDPQQYGQYDQQYQQGYEQQYQQGYEQKYQQGYEQQYQQGYEQQYQQGYEQQYQQGYEQQYQQGYEQQGYEQQYQQSYEQPVYEQPVYEEPAPEEPAPVKRSSFEASEKKEPQKPSGPDPYAASKDFKFVRKEKPDEEEQSEPEPEKPKNAKEFLDTISNTSDYTSSFDPNNFAENKKYCKLAVLGITFWVPFVFAKDSLSARFYANQGFLIFILEVIAGIFNAFICGGIVQTAFYINDPYNPHLGIMGWIFDLIFTAIFFAVPVFLIITAFKNIDAGRVKDIPLIGKLRILR